jgi:hypothetical protein
MCSSYPSLVVVLLQLFVLQAVLNQLVILKRKMLILKIYLHQVQLFLQSYHVKMYIASGL